jgi:Ca2+/Na+ antiporter
MARNIFAICLIAGGSFLEVWYYKIRFNNDGIEDWLSLIIGITLTLFLCIAVLLRQKKWVKVVIGCLLVYSVLATSAGQSFSLAVKEKIEIESSIKEQYTQDEINDIEYRIKQIDQKYSQIQAAIEETTKTLHDRGMYRTTLAAAEEEQRLLNEERAELQNRLSGLRTIAITHEGIEQKKTNIYEFYNTLTSIPVVWLQFIFQTILSVFIAIMAPLGIMTLQEVVKPAQPKKDINDWRQLVAWWVYVNWMGVRSGKSKNIADENTFMVYSKKHGKIYTPKQYAAIKKAAQNTGCIEGERVIINQNEANKRIMGVLNE